MKKFSFIVLAFVLLSAGIPSLASASMPLTLPTDVSQCQSNPGWKAYTNDDGSRFFVNLTDCVRFVLGDRIGNPAIPSTLLDPGTNLFIEDMNNPASQAASVKEFVFYAANTQPLVLALIDQSGNILYASSQITPTVGVNVYKVPQLIGVPAGTNVAVAFPNGESIPYTVTSTSSPDVVQQGLTRMPVGGDVISNNGADGDHTYSIFAQYIPTSDVPYISTANGTNPANNDPFTFNNGSTGSFYIYQDMSPGGVTFGSAHVTTSSGRNSGPVECATFIGSQTAPNSVVFAFPNQQSSGPGAGLWTLAEASVLAGGAQTYQQSFVSTSTAMSDCQAGVALGTVYPIQSGSVTLRINRYKK